MATYSKETSLFKTGAIGSGIQEAGEKATNYLSQDDSGIMIYDATDGNIQYPSTATSKNVFIDSNSVDIRNGQEVLATFGSTVQLGKSNSQNLTLSNDGLSFKVGNNKQVDIYTDGENNGGITFYKPNNGEQIKSGDIYSDSDGNLTIRSNGQDKGIFLATTAVNIPAIRCDDTGFSSLFSIVNRTVMTSRSISSGSVVNSSAVVTVPSDREIIGIVGYTVDSGDINVASLWLSRGVGSTGYSQTINYNIKNVGSVARTTALNVQLLCVRVNFIL